MPCRRSPSSSRTPATSTRARSPRTAWRQAAAAAYDTVVLLGTNHTTGDLRRVALYPGTGLRTPLGVVPIDQALQSALLKEPDTAADATPHLKEHSIEVHLPFVQRLFPKAAVIAAIVPPVEGVPARFGRALAKLLAGRRALVVASSDLSHYPSARDAGVVDRRTLEAMATLDIDRFRAAADGQLTRGVNDLVTCACGEAPVVAAMAAAAALGATRARLVSYANSGDVPVGDSERVVGYGAMVFSSGPRGADTSALDRPAPSAAASPLPASDRTALLVLARSTITPLPREWHAAARPPDSRLASSGRRAPSSRSARRENLRGCIGQMTPSGPLRRVVGAMAFAAAFEDPRFPKVRANEMKDIEIEISVLTPFREVASPSAIVPGRDGVLLQKGRSSAVFLPQVATEEGWGRDELLDNLCVKAGLSRGCWQSGARLSTFQADIFKETEAHR